MKEKGSRHLCLIMVMVVLLALGAFSFSGSGKIVEAAAVWTDQNSGTKYEIKSVSALDANHVWATAEDTYGFSATYKEIVLFYDGKAWGTAAEAASGVHLNDIYALDANHVWAVGYYYVGGVRAGLIAFFDGTSWSQQYLDPDRTADTDLSSVTAVDANHVWAVGHAGTILFFNGVSLSKQAGGGKINLEGVDAVDANHVWAVGSWDQSTYAGRILFYNGSSWTSQYSNADIQGFKSVSAVDANHVWAVGNYPLLGTVFFYNGTSWSEQWNRKDEQWDTSLFSVSATDANHVWAVGVTAELFQTSDGTIIYRSHYYVCFFNGTSWSIQSPEITGVEDSGQNLLNDVSAIATSDTALIWAVGNFGRIIFSSQSLQPQPTAEAFYFAEGTCRPGFDPYLCIQNPGTSDASVTITYMKGDGTTDTQDITVGKNSRSTVVVKNKLGEADDAAHDFSCKVESTNGQAIIAERPMYFNYKGAWTGGHDVMGYTP